MPIFTELSYCPNRLQQRRHVDLVGLVVAGERVHHDVDAGAEREFALARLARHHRQHRLAVRPQRPGAGEIVRRDDDRGDAVAGARRALLRFVVAFRRGGFDPELPAGKAAGKLLEQIEGLGQHVVARHRLELRDIERGEDGAQRLRVGRDAAAAGARLRSRRGCRTAPCRRSSCRRRCAPAPRARGASRPAPSASRSADRTRARPCRDRSRPDRRLRARCAARGTA